MLEATKNWIKKANKDLGTAIIAMQSIDGPLPVTTGMHCQLSAEKYLKAYLHEHETDFSGEHGLTSLLEECIATDKSFETLHSEIDQLEGYSIASRYPRIDDSLAFRQDAITAVQRIKEFVLSQLGAK